MVLSCDGILCSKESEWFIVILKNMDKSHKVNTETKMANTKYYTVALNLKTGLSISS